ncbi:PTS fructose transporter subunit IIB [Robertmurraya siralis]|uniref:PTS fructose transporter subunit IIB n=1 Tax=Robertmurraya siralis TaxID=77777 RepID=A0A919WI60_9BACI|nr:PTS transporter subunit EIIC [Robertmurraya siralis]PAE18414.1 PTS fructose transporter subunit IIB [Bacillus sp. 7504-2]GIN62473.1 PTS fructose transporter subunit IIB [Robertmurraya siralis]
MTKKEQFQKVAEDVLKAIGGKDNVSHVTHCMTRLRFNLKDESLPDEEEVKKIQGVIGVMKTGGQFQVIIGQTVDKVYQSLVEVGGFENNAKNNNVELAKKKITLKSIGSGILDGLAGSLTPLIPLLLAASMFKFLIALLGPSMLGLISDQSDIYILLDFVGDAGFYFFPIAVAYTAAKKFGATPVLAIFLGGILLHPTLMSMATEGNEFSVFGIPTSVQSYSSTVLPSIMSVWVMSYVERFFNRHLPSILKTIFAPSLTIIVMLPISLTVLGPAGSFLGHYFSEGILGLSDVGGFLAIAIIGAIWQFLVLSGMHLVMISMLILVFTNSGQEALVSPGATAASFAVAGMAIGAALRIRNKEQRGLSFGYVVANLVGGVTEPAMYGVGIRYKRPLLGMIAGGFAGGFYAGLFGVTAYAMIPVANFLNILGYVGGSTANLVHAVISVLISIVVAAVVTYFFGFKKDDPLIQKQQ